MQLHLPLVDIAENRLTKRKTRRSHKMRGNIKRQKKDVATVPQIGHAPIVQPPPQLSPNYAADLNSTRYRCCKCKSPSIRNLTGPCRTKNRTLVIVWYCLECKHRWEALVAVMKEAS